LKKSIIIFLILALCSILVMSCASNSSTKSTQSSTGAGTSVKPTSSTAAPQPTGMIIETSVPSATVAKIKTGGTIKVMPVVCPSGALGWPAEGVGEISGLQQFALEPLMIEYWDGHLEPGLATSWTVADDRKSITLKLRNDVTFHDGTPFNAKAVKFNLDAIKDAKKPGTSYWTSIDVVDDYTVKVSVSTFVNTSFSTFAGGYCYMVSPTAFEKNGLQYMRDNIVGTGPFKFVSFTANVNAKFVKNPNYWRKGLPYCDGVEVVYIADQLTQLTAFQSGASDTLLLELGKNAGDLKNAGFKMPYRSTGMMTLIPDSANADSPWSKKDVRLAVEYAIDKKAICDAKGYGFWLPTTQVATRGTIAYDPNFVGRTYNPDKAKQLLTQAGYPDGFTSKIIVSPTGTDKDVAAAIQSYLGKVGIKVELDFPEYAKYLQYRQGKWNNALLLQPAGGFPNYNSYFTAYMATDSGVWLSLKRPDNFQAAIEESLSTTSPDVNKIKGLISKMYDEATVIPIHDTGQGTALQKPVEGGGFMTRGIQFLWEPWNVWLNK
jgi:peptide/nickel transport system substrate-binding protein